MANVTKPKSTLFLEAKGKTGTGKTLLLNVVADWCEANNVGCVLVNENKLEIDSNALIHACLQKCQ